MLTDTDYFTNLDTLIPDSAFASIGPGVSRGPRRLTLEEVKGLVHTIGNSPFTRLAKKVESEIRGQMMCYGDFDAMEGYLRNRAVSMVRAGVEDIDPLLVEELFDHALFEGDRALLDHLVGYVDVSVCSDGTPRLTKAKAYNEWATLISLGADPNAQDYAGNTALFDAHEAKARFLLQEGIDIHIENEMGQTALFHCSADVARLLIEEGADIDHEDNYGGRADDFASGARDAIRQERARRDSEAIYDAIDMGGKEGRAGRII